MPETCDIAYYRHSTRFDSGQLVDRTERRNVSEKLVFNSGQYLPYLRQALLQMRRGQVAYLKLGEKHHKGMYHK